MVGVTGHRDLRDRASLARSVARELAQLKAPIVGISALAAGADQLFAEAVIEEGGRLEVVLPGHDYRSTLPRSSLHRFDRLLAQAASVVTLEHDTLGGDAYLAAGLAMLERCDILFAIWDGEPSRGTGGTADLVERARAAAIPVRVISAVRSGA